MANETPAKKAAPARATTDQAAASGTPAAPATNPAAAAIADAVRSAEIEQLTRQRDRLREIVGETPTVDMLRAEVDALQQVAARAGITRSPRWTMSAGVASDLELNGYAVDPLNGDAYVRDGDRVTVTARSGETRTVDMPASMSAVADDAASSADRKS